MGVSFMATPTHPTLASASPRFHGGAHLAVAGAPASSSPALSGGQPRADALDAAMHAPTALSLPEHLAGAHASQHPELVPHSDDAQQEGEHNGEMTAHSGLRRQASTDSFGEEEDLLGGATRGGRSRVSWRGVGEESEEAQPLLDPPTPLKTPKSEAPSDQYGHADVDASAASLLPAMPPTTPAVRQPNFARISVSEHLQAMNFMAGNDDYHDYNIISPTPPSKTQHLSESESLSSTGDSHGERDGEGGNKLSVLDVLRPAEDEVPKQNGNDYCEPADHVQNGSSSSVENTNGHCKTSLKPSTPKAEKRKKKS